MLSVFCFISKSSMGAVTEMGFIWNSRHSEKFYDLPLHFDWSMVFFLQYLFFTPR